MSGHAHPLFTVVIPAYRSRKTVGQAIDSVLGQTLSDLELVVVDDGSPDDTPEHVAEMIAAEPRARLIRQENAGTAAAKNSGFEAARGRYVSFLDDDDLLMPRYLEAMRAVLEPTPAAGFAFTDGWLLDEATGRFSRTSMSPIAPPETPSRDPAALMRELIEGNFIATAVTVRREALASAGLHNERLTGVDDYELWLRLLSRGWAGVRAPGRLVIKRHRAGAQSQDEGFMIEQLQRALRTILDEHRPLPEVAAVARRRIDELDDARATAERGQASPLGRLRRASRAAAKRALRPLLWRRTPPREVRRAFPRVKWS